MLILLSNQVVQICDNLFVFSSTALGINSTNKLAAAAQYAWMTLQALRVMESYLKNKFRHHPAISSTFLCFLTQHMASQARNAAGLRVLTNQVKTLAANVKGRVTQEQLNKFDSKVDTLSKAK